MKGNSKEEGIYVYVWLYIGFAVQQKLIQHSKAIILLKQINIFYCHNFLAL